MNQLLVTGHPARRRQARQRWGGVCFKMGLLSGVAVSFLRSKLLPAAIVLLFALALVAVSARIWLPGDMAAPAPLS
ncbi:MAG: hypothetical protein VKO44_08605 [Cyanobacteriota bacterium]|nr:hypothetical protein [Cyanobacteriota bacterium]